jgi:hypothetical protein
MIAYQSRKGKNNDRFKIGALGGQMRPDCVRSRKVRGTLKPLVACTADFDLLDPFRGENLVSGKATSWVRVENRVNDITALALKMNQQVDKMKTLPCAYPSKYFYRAVAGFLFALLEVPVKKLVLALLCNTP